MDKLRVLFLASDPSDLARLRLGQELRDIREKLQLSKYRDSVVLESRESVRPGDITQAIFDVSPEIIHFSGHGTTSGELCFENSLGQAQLVQTDTLDKLFGLVADSVNCVILNACYSEVQAQAIAKHIPFVIGMNQAIGDKAAIAFSVGFYKALGAGRSFEDAYEFACIEIQLEMSSNTSIPVLYRKEATGASKHAVDGQDAGSTTVLSPKPKLTAASIGHKLRALSRASLFRGFLLPVLILSLAGTYIHNERIFTGLLAFQYDSEKYAQNQNYEFILMYKDTDAVERLADDIRAELIRIGFNQDTYEAVSHPESLYAYDREDGQAYLGIDSSVPADVRQRIVDVVESFIPSVNVQTIDKAADDYFLLWML